MLIQMLDGNSVTLYKFTFLDTGSSPVRSGIKNEPPENWIIIEKDRKLTPYEII